MTSEERKDLKENNAPAAAFSTRSMAITGMLIALCAVGSYIKIPSPTGTVAFDSASGYLAALLLGWKTGAIVAAIGHLLTALTGGFPLGLPMHLIVAVQMAVAAAAFAWIAKRKIDDKIAIVAAVAVAVIINGVIAPATLIPFYGMGFFTAMLLPLCVASLINIIIAAVIGKLLEKKITL